MVRSRRMRMAGNIARIGAKMNAHRVFVGRPEGERPLDDSDVGRTILKWIIVKQNAVL
jgi:hypothetical protein